MPENTAKTLLEIARRRRDDGDLEQYEVLLRVIVDQFGETAAAKEAKRLLAKRKRNGSNGPKG
jgi:hypothetical protein